MEQVLYTALKEISIGNKPGTRLSSQNMVLIAKIACGLYEAAQQSVERTASQSRIPVQDVNSANYVFVRE